MAGSAPVDSPTSIISTARSGKISSSSRLLERVCPSRTLTVASAIPFTILRLLIDVPAVSIAGTKGKPPCKSVDKVPSHHLLNVAALLARQQSRCVQLGKCALGRKRVGKRFAALDPVADIVQQCLQRGVSLALDQ